MSSPLAQIRQFRIDKAQKLKEMGIDPYPSKSNRTHFSGDITNNYEKYEGQEVTVSGRLMSWREHGPLIFGHIQDQSGKVQLYIRQETMGPRNVEQQSLGFEDLTLLDVGDIVEAKGIVTKTQRGEISIEPHNIRILTKAIRPLPEKWSGIKDKEVLHRQRYLDMIINPEKRWRFEKTAQITYAIRKFLNERGFLEIKTPIIQPVYGGTTAKPFKTHVNALSVDYYMAISHELYLKRLITAGFENVYNIVGYFRNEGIDRTHNPEFTMIETMSAFNNYEYNIELTQQMYKYICETVFGKTVFNIQGHEVDFGQPWERITMMDAVNKYAGIDFNHVQSLEQAHQILDQIGFNEPKPLSIGECMVVVFEEKVEKQLIKPTFVTGHPVEISPLAKAMESDPRFVERFEIFIGGIEGGDNWTELNDPVELFNRFKAQVDKGRGGKDEYHPMDIEFVEMMEYGMPPTTGLGPGIERLAMMLTETDYIDDVIFFPMLRPAQISEQQKELYGAENLTAKIVTPARPEIGVNETLTTQASGINIGQKEKSESMFTSANQDLTNKIVIVVNRELEKWQITNAVAHVSAYLGHKLENYFDTGENFVTNDGQNHPRNTQYPIVVLEAKPGQMSNLMASVRESGLLYHGFIREMIETSNDAEIENILANKKDEEVEYLGIGFYGSNDQVNNLTKKFSLLK